MLTYRKLISPAWIGYFARHCFEYQPGMSTSSRRIFTVLRRYTFSLKPRNIFAHEHGYIKHLYIWNHDDKTMFKFIKRILKSSNVFVNNILYSLFFNYGCRLHNNWTDCLYLWLFIIFMVKGIWTFWNFFYLVLCLHVCLSRNMDVYFFACRSKIKE